MARRPERKAWAVVPTAVRPTMTASNPTTNGDKERGSEINEIATMAHVGEERNRAIVIWFGDDRALRYVWDEEQGEVRKQKYVQGTVREDVGVGTCREEMLAYALETVADHVAQ